MSEVASCAPDLKPGVASCRLQIQSAFSARDTWPFCQGCPDARALLLYGGNPAAACCLLTTFHHALDVLSPLPAAELWTESQPCLCAIHGHRAAHCQHLPIPLSQLQHPLEQLQCSLWPAGLHQQHHCNLQRQPDIHFCCQLCKCQRVGKLISGKQPAQCILH